ncbi:DUF6687 family protein [Hymenobacter koreensis]|uniref:Uncharacterized protein n=1 Tax=Hymenobacter koreensis TaxID=1084523 RepID=A0ABP8IUP7_9BACT
MSELSFLPFAQARRRAAETVVVDSLLPGASLTLAHWRGAPTPVALCDDTSAGSVLRALRQTGAIPAAARYVTANHFDIDGFIGVWSLLNPEQARQHEELLHLVATLGDFRELDWSHPLATTALKLACWLNAKEQELFYPPFGAPVLRRREDEASAEKFAWFLPAFGAVLENPNAEAATWAPAYERVEQAFVVVQSPQTQLHRYPEIGLLVVHTLEPLPYYALFGPTAGYDMVLSCYAGQRYEFEYKYTTWIDLESRPTRPRLPLHALAASLNAAETAPHRWTFEAVTDTGPLLRLAGKTLSKVQRYADPDQRPIHASTISPEAVEQEVVQFFRQRYAHIEPLKDWTWEQIRAAGAAVATLA